MNEPQASLTPTPETDEAIAEVEQHGSVFPLIKHARRLERQRDKLVAAIDKARRETASAPENRWCRNATLILNVALAEVGKGES